MEKEDEPVRFSEADTEASEKELKSVALTGLLVSLLLILLTAGACYGLVWLGIRVFGVL